MILMSSNQLLDPCPLKKTKLEDLFLRGYSSIYHQFFFSPVDVCWYFLKCKIISYLPSIIICLVCFQVKILQQFYLNICLSHKKLENSMPCGNINAPQVPLNMLNECLYPYYLLFTDKEWIIDSKNNFRKYWWFFYQIASSLDASFIYQ